MIKKELAIYMIKANADPVYSAFTFNDDYSKGYKSGIEDALYAIQKIQDEDNWIPVNEKLPDKSGRYLVTTSESADIILSLHTHEAYYCRQLAGDNHYWTIIDEKENVRLDKYEAVAWQPLPEEYKEK